MTHKPEHVPHNRWPAPTPTNTDRLRAWKAKMAERAEVEGNGYFQFCPVFDPPEAYNVKYDKRRGE